MCNLKNWIVSLENSLLWKNAANSHWFVKLKKSKLYILPSPFSVLYIVANNRIVSVQKWSLESASKSSQVPADSTCAEIIVLSRHLKGLSHKNISRSKPLKFYLSIYQCTVSSSSVGDRGRIAAHSSFIRPRGSVDRCGNLRNNEVIIYSAARFGDLLVCIIQGWPDLNNELFRTAQIFISIQCTSRTPPLMLAPLSYRAFESDFDLRAAG